MSDIESLQLELDSLVCQQTVPKLAEFITYLNLSVDVAGKSRRELVKAISIAIENTVLEPGDVDLDIYLRDAIAYLTCTVPPLEKTPEESKVTKLEMKLLALKLEQQQKLEAVIKELEEEKHRLNEGDQPSFSERGSASNQPKENVLQPPVAVPSFMMSAPSILHREFKISGQIGEPGQYDKLTYVSLIHQIDSGLAKGYSEKDVADAVIKSISPHSSLRNYVLTSPDHSLKKLRSILRVFFQEKTAADFYQALVTTTQTSKETAQQFLLRALDARNKVFFATQEEKSSDEYPTQLVQNTFLKTVETGLRDESLVTNLRPFLRQGGITDEELMKHLNDLATVQAERKAKSFSAPAHPRAAAANAECIDPELPLKNTKNQRQRENDCITKTLSAEVKELKSELEELKQNFVGKCPNPPRFQNNRGQGRRQYQRYGQYQRYSRREIGCPQCRSIGKGNTCQHCFKCGDINHFQAQCPLQENFQRLFQGDEE